NRIAFVRDRKIFIAPIDGSKPPEQAFFVRGSAGSPTWDAAGRRLAFVNDRDDHAFIGIFTDGATTLKYISTTTSRDSQPLWNDAGSGDDIAFVRQPGRGGVPQSPLVQTPSPWAIMVGRETTAPAAHPARAWESGKALADSPVRIAGLTNLQW